MFLIYFLIGIALIFLLFAGAKAFAQAKPAQLVTGLRVAGGIGAALAGVWLLLTGRISLVLMLASMFAPVLARWRSAWRQQRRASNGPSPGESSNVETAWLRMSLDHATGILDGTVLQGRFSGRHLGELSIPELTELLARLRVADPDSALVLETYLGRARPEWRDDAGGAQQEASEAPRATSSNAMTKEEAYRILGLEKGANARAIRDAHRKLMMKLHPDQGGSTYLAAKINQAKDLLLKD